MSEDMNIDGYIHTSDFAIQEWVEKGDIKSPHIQDIANPSDSLTNDLGCKLHHFHLAIMMGHVGSKYTPAPGKI
eukprot:2424299-Ditylum_brightwellii.AAC.1